MKILYKFPTRGRCKRFYSTLDKYYEFIEDIDNSMFLINIDTTDIEMVAETKNILSYKNSFVAVSNNKNKIQACNAAMIEGWDICVLVSDDMIPQIKGFDNIIRRDMILNFPNLDGVLWYNDGFQQKLITQSIIGERYYKRFNYLYHPDYKSVFCDNEFTIVAMQLNKVRKFDECIIRHEHPVNGIGKLDEIYKRNEIDSKKDYETLIRRSKFNFGLK